LGQILNSLARQGKVRMTGPGEYVISIPGTPAGIRYQFSTTTADADPGAGRLRLNQAVQNTATVLRVDPLDTNGTDFGTIITAFHDSTATPKGYIPLTAEADPSQVLVFSNGAVASPGGYYNITVTNVVS